MNILNIVHVIVFIIVVVIIIIGGDVLFKISLLSRSLNCFLSECFLNTFEMINKCNFIECFRFRTMCTFSVVDES